MSPGVFGSVKSVLISTFTASIHREVNRSLCLSAIPLPYPLGFHLGFQRCKTS